jgi:hypothetical protein
MKGHSCYEVREGDDDGGDEGDAADEGASEDARADDATRDEAVHDDGDEDDAQKDDRVEMSLIGPWSTCSIVRLLVGCLLLPRNCGLASVVVVIAA